MSNPGSPEPVVEQEAAAASPDTEQELTDREEMTGGVVDKKDETQEETKPRGDPDSVLPSLAALVPGGPSEGIFDKIIAAAKEPEPFSSLEDPLGEGPMSIACKVDRASCFDAAGHLTDVAVGDLDVGFNLFALCIEIFRDFFQLMSLMFSFVFVVPFNVRIVFGTFAFFLNLDFSMLLPTFSAEFPSLTLPKLQGLWTIVWWVIFVVSIILMIYLRYIVHSVTPKPGREFLMCKTWAMMDKGAVRKVRVLIFLLTLLYLPVSQRALEILFCSYRYVNIFGTCPGLGTQISSIIALIVVTIILPINLGFLIAKNRPKHREFDSSGEPLAVFTAEMYKKDLAAVSRRNPLAGLFNAYRRKMAFFKIIIMGLKFWMVLVSVLLSSNGILTGHRHAPVEGATTVAPTGSASSSAAPQTQVIPETENDVYNHLRPALMCFGLIFYTILCLVQKPFLSNVANILDVILRTFGVLVVILAWLIMFNVEPDALSWIMVVLFIIVFIVSIAFIVLSVNAVQEKVRISRGDVDLCESEVDENKKMWFCPNEIDYAKERKVRTWMYFWDSFLGFYKGHTPPLVNPGGAEEEIVDEETGEIKKEYPLSFDYVDTEDTTAYLLGFKGSIAERHHENREIVADVGREIYMSALTPLTDHDSKAIIFATRMLHGRDCYFGDGTGNPQNGCFGALYVIPFPFEAYHVADGTHVQTKLHATDLKHLIADNCNNEIRRRRIVRENLRGIAFVNSPSEQTYFHFTEMQTISKQTGTDDKGNPTYTNYSVLCTFSYGELTVKQDYETPVFEFLDPKDGTMQVTPGFAVSFSYDKGTYTDHGGGEVGSRTLSQEELGVYEDYRQTPQLSALFDRNADKVTNGRRTVLARKDAFRLHFMREFLCKQETLSYAFFAEVYDDDYVSVDAANRHLTVYEKNEKIQEIGTKATERQQFLDMAQLRLQYYDCCKPVAIWVCFWQDLFTQNLEMELIAKDEEAKKVLNPWLPDSLSWNIMSKAKTNEVLQGAKLQTPEGKGFISAGLIDQLFDSMAEAAKDSSSSSDTAKVTTSSKFTEYYEVPGLPLYKASCVPLFDTEINSRGLAWLQEVTPTVAEDFYSSQASMHASMHAEEPLV